MNLFRRIGFIDVDELYDLQEDRTESRNLIFSPKRQAIIKDMREHLFDVLEGTDAMNIPLQRDRGNQQNLRSPEEGRWSSSPTSSNVRRPRRGTTSGASFQLA